jgi:cupin 2 domain-containing protein
MTSEAAASPRETGNLFDQRDPPAIGSERLATLWSAGAVRVARIESSAHASPDGFWYDQDDDEWVVVLEGDAVIEFDDGDWHALGTGDWIVIPAHARHRIVHTAERTVWLAVHVGKP